MHMNRKSALLAGAVPFMLETRDSGDSVAEIKKQIDGFMHAFEEFKKANDASITEKVKKGAADVLSEIKVDKLNAELDKLEALNQRLTKAENEVKAAKVLAEEERARGDDLEKKLNRPRLGNGDDRKELLRKQVNTWARGVILAHTVGVPNLSKEQQKALADVEAEYKAMTISNDATGGYLAPSEFVMEIIKGVTEMSPARSLARVRRTGAKSIMLPKRTGQFAARRTLESQTRTETTGLEYGMVEIFAPEMYALIDISTQNMEDGAFDLEAEIRGEAEEQFAVKEGQEFVSGTGVQQIEGFLTNAGVGTNNSGAATTITADGFITIKHALKTAYTRNASWALNRTTLGSTRKLKGGDGHYIWQPGLAQGRPNTIDGDPYVEVPDMPSEGAGLKPVAYGDFARACVIVDRVAMEMLRDPFTQATSGNIRFLFRRRVGGAVVLAEAIRVMVCAA